MFFSQCYEPCSVEKTSLEVCSREAKDLNISSKLNSNGSLEVQSKLKDDAKEKSGSIYYEVVREESYRLKTKIRWAKIKKYMILLEIQSWHLKPLKSVDWVRPIFFTKLTWYRFYKQTFRWVWRVYGLLIEFEIWDYD